MSWQVVDDVSALVESTLWRHRPDVREDTRKEGVTMNWTSSRLVGAKPFGLQRSDLRGAQMPVADILLTPIARRLMVWWPGGGAVYTRPVAVEYVDGSRTRRIRIVPIQSLGFGALAALGLAAVAASFALRHKDRWRDTEN
jgi:hypothetical protein